MALVLTPGKFEGEPTYVPHIWNVVLEGCADEEWYEDEDHPISAVKVDSDLAATFPDLQHDIGKYIVVWEDNSGFVHHQIVTQEELDEQMSAA